MTPPDLTPKLTGEWTARQYYEWLRDRARPGDHCIPRHIPDGQLGGRRCGDAPCRRDSVLVLLEKRIAEETESTEEVPASPPVEPAQPTISFRPAYWYGVGGRLILWLHYGCGQTQLAPTADHHPKSCTCDGPASQRTNWRLLYFREPEHSA